MKAMFASACIVLSLAAAQAPPSDVQHNHGSGKQQNRPQPQPPATSEPFRQQPPAANSAPNPTKAKDSSSHHDTKPTNHAWPTWEDIKRWFDWKPGLGWAEVAAVGALAIAVAGVAVSFLTLIVTALFLRYTYLMWKEMVRQNNNADTDREESKRAAEEDRKLLRRQLEAYDRPWLTVSMSPGKSDRKFEQFGFYKGGGDAHAWFGLKVKNIGKSLATNVTVTARLIAFRNIIEDLPKELETAKPMHAGEFTLFPEEFNDGLFNDRNTPIAEVEAMGFQLAEGGEVFVDMALIGRVVYRFATSDDPHHTDFAYKIARRVGDNVMPFVIVGNTLWSDEVVWLKLPGDHAN